MANSQMTCVPVRPSASFSGSKKMCMHCLLKEEGIVLMPAGIFDALFSGILQSFRFKAGFVSSSPLPTSTCLDIGLTPLEMADVARTICIVATDIAFIVDVGWCGEVRNVIFSYDGTMTAVYRVTVHGLDGEALRESTGSVSLNDE